MIIAPSFRDGALAPDPESRDSGFARLALAPRNDGENLQLPQQRIAAGNLDLAGGRLEIELLDDAVIHQHRIAVRANAEPIAGGIQLHADRLGEFGIAVGEEGGFIALVGVALPGVHDEGIVDRDDRDRVHALVLHGVGVEKDARQMHLVAGAGIGAGHREQRDLLALEDLVGGLDLQTVRRHHAKFCLGQLVANFDGHRQFSSIVRMSLKPGKRRAQYSVPRKRQWSYGFTVLSSAGKPAIVEKGLFFRCRDAPQNAIAMGKAPEPGMMPAWFSAYFRFAGSPALRNSSTQRIWSARCSECMNGI